MESESNLLLSDHRIGNPLATKNKSKVGCFNFFFSFDHYVYSDVHGLVPSHSSKLLSLEHPALYSITVIQALCVLLFAHDQPVLDWDDYLHYSNITLPHRSSFRSMCSFLVIISYLAPKTSFELMLQTLWLNLKLNTDIQDGWCRKTLYPSFGSATVESNWVAGAASYPKKTCEKNILTEQTLIYLTLQCLDNNILCLTEVM